MTSLIGTSLIIPTYTNLNRLPSSCISGPKVVSSQTGVKDEVKVPVFPAPPFKRDGPNTKRVPSRSVFAEWKEVFYSLGDEGSDDDMILFEDPHDHVMAVGRLLENEYAFVRRSGGKFCFAMIKSLQTKTDGLLMELYVSEAGATKSIPMSEWGRYIRPKKPHVSYIPPPVVEASTPKGKNSRRSTVHDPSARKSKGKSRSSRHRRASLPVMQDIDGQRNTHVDVYTSKQASNPVRPQSKNKSLKAQNRRASCPETVRDEHCDNAKWTKEGRRGSAFEIKRNNKATDDFLDKHVPDSLSSSKSDVDQYVEDAIDAFLSSGDEPKQESSDDCAVKSKSKVIHRYLEIMDEVTKSPIHRSSFRDGSATDGHLAIMGEAAKSSSDERAVKLSSTAHDKHQDKDGVEMKCIRRSSFRSSLHENSATDRCVEIMDEVVKKSVHKSDFRSSMDSSRRSSLRSTANSDALDTSENFDHDEKSLHVSWNMQWGDHPGTDCSKPNLSDDDPSPNTVAKFIYAETLPPMPQQQLRRSLDERRLINESQLIHATGKKGNCRRATVGAELNASHRFNETQLLSAFAMIRRLPFETSKKGQRN